MWCGLGGSTWGFPFVVSSCAQTFFHHGRSSMCIADNFPVFLRASVVLDGSSGTMDGPLCLVALNRVTEIAEDASSMAVVGGQERDGEAWQNIAPDWKYARSWNETCYFTQIRRSGSLLQPNNKVKHAVHNTNHIDGETYPPTYDTLPWVHWCMGPPNVGLICQWPHDRVTYVEDLVPSRVTFSLPALIYSCLGKFTHGLGCK